MILSLKVLCKLPNVLVYCKIHGTCNFHVQDMRRPFYKLLFYADRLNYFVFQNHLHVLIILTPASQLLNQINIIFEATIINKKSINYVIVKRLKRLKSPWHSGLWCPPRDQEVAGSIPTVGKGFLRSPQTTPSNGHNQEMDSRTFQ